MKLLLLLIVPVFCFSQNTKYTQLKKLPKPQFEKAVYDSIVKLDASELGSFLKTLKNQYKTNLKPFENGLIDKFENTSTPLGMYSFLKMLIELKADVARTENYLNEKKPVWDNGYWAERFWVIIRQNKLKVKEDVYYTVNDKGQKNYKLRLLLEDKVVNNEIGANPLLMVNGQLTEFPSNQLYETLQNLTIQDISIIPVEESTDLFGKRGTDGMLKVLTRETK